MNRLPQFNKLPIENKNVISFETHEKHLDKMGIGGLYSK